jgi:uncharacterized membrane protein
VDGQKVWSFVITLCEVHIFSLSWMLELLICYELDKAMEMLRRGEITDAKTMVGLFWAEKLASGDWKAHVRS